MKRAAIAFVLLLLSLARVASASAPTKDIDDAVVHLSPFEVSANSVEFKSWIKVGSPHFIVYTDTSEKEAAAVLRELEQLHIAAQRFFRRKALNLPPMTLVLPTSRSDWRKIENKGNVEWHVAVSHHAERVANLVLVQYDWQKEGLWIVRAAQGRAELRAVNLSGPFWFERGVGKFFETAEFSNESVKLGRQNSRTLALAHEGWLPWAKFFQVTPRSAEFTKEREVERYEGQCALLVQAMLANPDAGWTDRLISWVARLNAGREPSEEEFKSVFGQDWKAWQDTMRNFLDGGRYQIQSLKFPEAVNKFSVATFDLPVREMRELFVLSQVLNQDVPASYAALDSILANGLKTESLRELLVEACFDRKRPAAALDQLRVLLAAHTPNPAVYAVLAGAVIRARVPQINLHSRLGDEAGEVRALCRQALDLEPLYEPANDFLAWAEALGPNVAPANLAAIERIFHALEGRASTSDAVAALAVGSWRIGDVPWARRLAQTLAESPYADRDGKRISAELLKEIGAPRAATGGRGDKR